MTAAEEAAARTPSAPAAKPPDASLRQRLRFRPATRGDADPLAAVINEAYLRETWLLPPPRITLAQLNEVLEDARQRVTIAEINGAIAGCVRLSRHEGQLYFGLLAVAPLWQGRGLAALLIAEAERQAREIGDTELRLDCAKELGLPPFYESLGYKVESETPDSYYDDGQSGRRKGPFTLAVMRKDMI